MQFQMQVALCFFFNKYNFYFYTLLPLIQARYLSIRWTMLSGIVEYYLQNCNSIKSIIVKSY